MIINYKRGVWSQVPIYIILFLFFLWTVLPIYQIITNSFKATLEIKSIPPSLFFHPTITHYQKILIGGEFGNYFINSLIVALTTTLISVLGGAFGAYGLMITKSRWARVASNSMLIGKMVPTITILIPFYIILNTFRVGGTYLGPILAHSSVNLPFVIWLIISFAKAIPKEITEAAMVDGARRMQTFWKIIFPLLLPAIASAIILSMQFSWNELLYSLQLTSMDSYTLPVGIARFVGPMSYYH